MPERPPAAAPIIVTAAFPFVPAVLSIAHAGSTYLPADVTVRLLRMLGRKAVLATGMDVHSILVSRDGLGREGVEPACDASEAAYLAFLTSWGIEPDLWFRTDEADHVERTCNSFRQLLEVGALAELPRKVDICTGCNAAVPPRLAADSPQGPSCPWCGTANPKSQDRNHFHLLLEPLRGEIESAIARFPAHSRRWLRRLCEEPLLPWCVTRDNRVGITVDGDEARSLYIWFDSLIGYLTVRARLAAGDRDFDSASLLQFFGKNIIFHHGIVQPALMTALGSPFEACASVRGFLVGTADLPIGGLGTRDARRLYLCFKTFDGPRDFILAADEFEAFRAEQVVGRLAGLLRRCALQACRGDFDASVGEKLIGRRVAELAPVLERHALRGEPRLALLVLLAEVKRLTAKGQQDGWLIDATATARGTAAGALALLLTLFAPYAPAAVDEFAIFEGWSPTTLAEASKALFCKTGSRTLLWPE